MAGVGSCCRDGLQPAFRDSYCRSGVHCADGDRYAQAARATAALVPCDRVVDVLLQPPAVLRDMWHGADGQPARAAEGYPGRPLIPCGGCGSGKAFGGVAPPAWGDVRCLMRTARRIVGCATGCGETPLLSCGKGRGERGGPHAGRAQGISVSDRRQ